MSPEEDDELANLTTEGVLAAIEAVKGRAWDINPFTVADELKVSRALIYRHAEAMKLIITARGGSFGMDVQTSLDLSWQLRKLEQEYSQLKEKLATGLPQVADNALFEELAPKAQKSNEPVLNKTEDLIFNAASSDPYSGDYSKLLANMTWKDVQTIYDFKVASLKDYATNLFPDGEKSFGEEKSISSVGKYDSGKHETLNSASPFAQLKTSRTKIGSISEPLSQQTANEPSVTESPAVPHIEGTEASFVPGTETLLPSSVLLSNTLSETVTPQPQLMTEFVQIKEETKELVNDDVAIQPVPQLDSDSLQAAKGPLKLNWYSQPGAAFIDFENEDIGEKAADIITQAVTTKANQEVIAEQMVTSIRREDDSSESASLDATVVQDILVNGEINTGELEPVKASELEMRSKSLEDLEPVQEAKTGQEQELEKAPQYLQEEQKEELQQDNVVSGDELRNLIHSHIKNAADQMADIHSIGAGKEFEVFLNNPSRSKFVGSTKSQESSNPEDDLTKSNSPNVRTSSSGLPGQAVFRPKIVPPEVRKSCLILGIRTDNIAYEIVQDAWKKSIAAPGVHPDQGGDTEMAVYLNTAKDVLMRWLDAQAPKLGKKFGPNKIEKDAQPKRDKKNKDQQ